jgi:succinyl-CoA synthetase beta subunit
MGGRVAVKAQVHAGGRGKAGGIKLARSDIEAALIALDMIGSRLVTPQTGSEGVPVRKVLVEQAVNLSRELYLGIIVDPATGLPVIMASDAGGMDIEEVAAVTPERILKIAVDPVIGFQPFQGRALAYALKLEPAQVQPAVAFVGSLYRAFMENDGSLLEINPLAVTDQGRLLALDAKFNIEDNALFRHPELEALRDTEQEDPLEVEARAMGINNYIKLTGDIGCIVNVAGLAMGTIDLIKLAGGEPANFLDIGTVNDVGRVVNAFQVLRADPAVKAVFINIFGGLARVDIIAEGIVEAFRNGSATVPVVTRLAGTNVADGKRILAEAGLPVTQVDGLNEAAKTAVRIARDTAMTGAVSERIAP